MPAYPDKSWYSLPAGLTEHEERVAMLRVDLKVAAATRDGEAAERARADLERLGADLDG